MNRNIKLLLLLSLFIFTPGCAPAMTQFDFNGKRWILQSINGQELPEDINITLQVTQQELSGSSGCNMYIAKYSAEPLNRNIISELVTTAMACSEPVGIMEQKSEYHDTLRRVTSYRYEEEKLFLLNGHGDTLLEYQLLPKFNSNPQGLTGNLWRLKHADDMADDELGSFTLWFDGNTLGGTTSCRDYAGIYQITDDSIRVTRMEMTSELQCSQEEFLAEGTYTTLLGWIDQYNILGNQLELYTVQNDKLIYESEPGE